VSTTFNSQTNRLSIKLSNSSLVIDKGVVVPAPPAGCGNQTLSSAVMQAGAQIPFEVQGDTLVVSCKPGGETNPVLINGDVATCFLYSKDSGLPAPPLALPCSA
jgi:hypothetical protein